MLSRLFSLICCCSLFIGVSLAADESYWDSNLVRAYVYRSEMQRRWAISFLAPHLRQLNGDEHVLDIGCGDGKVTADLSKFVPDGDAIGIDPSIPMLEWAKKQYCPLEYPNLFFQEGGFLEPQVGQTFDLIISTCAFQHCPDQYRALKNCFQLLNPNGKLCILTPSLSNSAWNEARRRVQTQPKWDSYWKDVRPRKMLPAEEYGQMLLDVGFQPIRVEKVLTSDPFFNREEFVNFLMGTFTPSVPPPLMQEFWNEVVDEYLQLAPDALLSNGVIEARFGRIEIEAVKTPLAGQD